VSGMSVSALKVAAHMAIRLSRIARLAAMLRPGPQGAPLKPCWKEGLMNMSTSKTTALPRASSRGWPPAHRNCGNTSAAIMARARAGLPTHRRHGLLVGRAAKRFPMPSDEVGRSFAERSTCRRLARERAHVAPQPASLIPAVYLPDERHSSACDRFSKVRSRHLHRGPWCPYCLININALAHTQEKIASEGGQIVAIMPDRNSSYPELKSAAKVPFPILTDNGQRFTRLSLNFPFGRRAAMQKCSAACVPAVVFQGNTSWILPIPCDIFVAKDGL